MQLKQYSGFPFPAVQKGPQGALRYVKENTTALIKSSIAQILLTAKGERPWNPEFGCDLTRFLFEVANPADMETIQNICYDAIVRWEPRVRLSPLDIVVAPSQTDPGRLAVSISYHEVATTTPTKESLTLTI